MCNGMQQNYDFEAETQVGGRSYQEAKIAHAIIFHDANPFVPLSLLLSFPDSYHFVTRGNNHPINFVLPLIDRHVLFPSVFPLLRSTQHAADLTPRRYFASATQQLSCQALCLPQTVSDAPLSCNLECPSLGTLLRIFFLCEVSWLIIILRYSAVFDAAEEGCLNR